MYPNMMLIYIAIGIFIVIGVAILVFVALIYKNTKGNKVQTIKQPNLVQADSVVEAGVVFCRNCASQFSSNEAICPNCKTPR